VKSLVRIFLVLSACAIPALTQAQNPDPRDYEVGYFVPNHTTIINTYLRQVSATEGRDYSAQALALRATYILKLGDIVVTPFDAILPVQNIDLYTPASTFLNPLFGAINPALAGQVPNDFKLNTHTSGMGDFTYLPTIGHGLTQDAENHTHTWYALTVYITAPTGRYDKDRVLNVGGNRWIFNPLIVIGQRFARAFTLELMGNVSFYTNNDEYRMLTRPGRDLDLKQKPSFGAAAHFAVDLHPMFYFAVSYYFAANGKRTFDDPGNPAIMGAAGVGGDDLLDVASGNVHTIRTNFGIRVTPQTLILAQWNEDVAGSNKPGIVKGRFFGLRITHAFFAPAKRPTRAPITDPASRDVAPVAPDRPTFREPAREMPVTPVSPSGAPTNMPVTPVSPVDSPDMPSTPVQPAPN